MFVDSRRAGGGDRTGGDVNGYVETDPTRRYGRFNEVLGKGATKTVYRAFDELDGVEVAWNQAKLCDIIRSPEALQRMYSEVHLLSTLDHDSIIRFHASWIDVANRTFNFITEMFTSGSLREYRQKYRRVDIRAVKKWAKQILRGLVYLHGHDPPVIHRDLKCDNIFVNGHLGQVKIGDLGLAAVLLESQNAHSVIGTPEFMAPELYEEDYNELVDIYAFGMCVLEMLTAEYPYRECTNPAQIYKKVSSGKLPDAFHRIPDTEAKRFIGRCLDIVSRRSSAMDLLSDPFLVSNDHHHHKVPLPSPVAAIASATLRTKGAGPNRREVPPGVCDGNVPARRTDMTITGKLNPEDDNIFLKVQIGDKDGQVRNIYFPFDIVSDTPIDVANEMVKELEITDREPSDIAQVIAQEITMLVPTWSSTKLEETINDDNHRHVYNYGDDIGHPFDCMPSPTSSHMSEFEHYKHAAANHADWLTETLTFCANGTFSHDDDEGSVHSGMYSSMNYISGNEQNNPPSLQQAQPHPDTRDDHNGMASKFSSQCSVTTAPETSRASAGRKGKKMTRNQSMGDMRGQLLNRTLLEGLKKRLFKTVGAVENIGFQIPYDDTCKSPSSSSSSLWGDRKKHGKGRG